MRTTRIRNDDFPATRSASRYGALTLVECGVARGVLAAAILLFIPGLLDPFNDPKALVIAAVGVPALGAVLLEVVTHPRPWAVTLLKLLATRRAALAVDAGIASWAVAALVTTAGSVSPRLSVSGELLQRDGLLTTLGLVGVYSLMRRSHRNAGHVRRTIQVVLASAAIAAGYAVLQLAGRDPIAWTGTTRYPSAAGSVLRPFATLGNPILLGAVLAPALGIVTVRLVTGSRRLGWWSALFGLLSVGLLSTLSRGAWLSGACGVVAAAAGAAWYRVGGSIRRAALALGAGAIAPVGVALWTLRTSVLARAGETLTAGPGSAPARREIAHAALALWRGHPWLGTGPDTFGLMFPRAEPLAYGGGLWSGLPGQAHSVPLQVLVTMGALGALSGASCLAALLAALRTRPQEAAHRRERLELAVGCVCLVVFGAVNHVGVAGATLFVALSAMLSRSRDGEDFAMPPPRQPLVIPALALALSIALAWNAMPGIAALAAAARARAALQQSVGASGERRWAFLGTASNEAGVAVVRAPGEDELWRSYCDADLALGREALRRDDLAGTGVAFDRAERSARRAIRLEPLRATNHQALGDALASQARFAVVMRRPAAVVAAVTTRSDSAFAQARSRAPRDALILIDETRAELELGRAYEARVTAQRIVDLYPEAAAGYSLLAAAQLMLGERPAAVQSLRAAVRGRWMEEQGADESAARAYLRQLESGDSTQ